MSSAARVAALAALVLLTAGTTPAGTSGIPLGSGGPGEGEVVAVEGEVVEIEGEVADILERFANSDGALTTEETAEAPRFTLAADVYFAFGSAQLEPRAVADLGQVAEDVRASGTTALVVVGHTDGVGEDADNQLLSEARAQAVAAALGGPLPGVTIRAEGRGEAEPIAPETVDGQDNPAGRALNRRVVITAG